MSRRKRKSKHASKHHIKPRSRGGDSSLENIAIIDARKHVNYHELFGNRMPDEIVEHLVRKYWNGQWDYVRQAYERNR